jgi:Ras-related protein Rab-1A
VCGDPGVGKTSTILRFTDNAFNRRYIPTMGTNISDKLFIIGGSAVELIIWDIAGQSKFETMRKHFYQGSEAIILIFDLTNPDSFESIRDWYRDITKYLPNASKIVGYVFGNKNDIVDERKVNNEDAIQLAKELNLNYVEISALTGHNVEFAFYKIAETLIKSKSKDGMFN